MRRITQPARSTARIGTLLLGLMLGQGCALKTSRTGLVQVVDDRVLLQEQNGRIWRISSAGQGEFIAGLDRCEVDVDASRFGGKLMVRDWKVRSAPGGGQPFVGRLRLYGSNWLIDDRSTGREVIVDMRGVEDMAQHAGSTVLIVGFVVGAQTVRPVNWWVVAP